MIPKEEYPPGELERRFQMFGTLTFEDATNLDLEYMASSLKGATMPSGQKYEHWRRAPETPALLKKLEEVRWGPLGHEENSGPS